MSRKSKIKSTAQTPAMDQDCFDCMEALAKCVHEGNPASRAMLKEKAQALCKICSCYQSINTKKK